MREGRKCVMNSAFIRETIVIRQYQFQAIKQYFEYMTLGINTSLPQLAESGKLFSRNSLLDLHISSNVNSERSVRRYWRV